MDTEGLVLGSRVHSAKVHDEDGIKLLLESARTELSRLKHLWVDVGYRGRGRRWAEEALRLRSKSYASPRNQYLRRWLALGRKSGLRRARKWTGRG